MNRTALTDGSGKWFDETRAQKFENGTRWDGNNLIGLSAGQFNTHWLYRTASGRWVLHFFSQWQGTTESYTEISDEEAAEWFIVNEYGADEIPADLLPLLQKHIGDLEI